MPAASSRRRAPCSGSARSTDGRARPPLASRRSRRELATALSRGRIWRSRAGGGAPLLPSSKLLVEVAQRAAAGETPASVAAGFHATFIRLAADLTVRAFGEERGTVAVGGGCVVNRILSSGLAEALEDLGFEVLLPRNVPPGDGGLSYGQAVLAAVSAARGVKPRQVGIENLEP